MKGGTYVGDTQRGEVVPLAVLAASHPITRTRTAGRASPERRRDVAALLGTDTASTSGAASRGGGVVRHARSDVGAVGTDGCHGVLVRAAGREMLAVADTALDLLVLELVLEGLGAGILARLLLVLAPVRAGAEDDVLTDRGSVGSRTGRVLGAEAELGPRLAVGDARVHLFGVRRVADAAGHLHLFALVIVAEGDDRLGAVLVADGLGRGELGRRLLNVFVVGPVVPG